MRSAGTSLGQNLEAAGLNLATLGVDDIERVAEGANDEPEK